VVWSRIDKCGAESREQREPRSRENREQREEYVVHARLAVHVRIHNTLGVVGLARNNACKNARV
jgi:hypothetical protein